MSQWPKLTMSCSYADGLSDYHDKVGKNNNIIYYYTDYVIFHDNNDISDCTLFSSIIYAQFQGKLGLPESFDEADIVETKVTKSI